MVKVVFGGSTCLAVFRSYYQNRPLSNATARSWLWLLALPSLTVITLFRRDAMMVANSHRVCSSRLHAAIPNYLSTQVGALAIPLAS